MSNRIILNRQQLESFIKDQRTIIAFEQLFQLVFVDQPSENDSLEITRDTGLALVSSLFDKIQDVIELMKLHNFINLEQKISKDNEYLPPFVQDFKNRNNEYIVDSSVSVAGMIGVEVATLTNSPKIGDPDKWIKINDNGIERYIPTWSL